MTTNGKLVVTPVAGMGVGGILATTIHAQTKTPPAYFMSEATIEDPDLYRKFLAEEPLNSQFGGRQLVRMHPVNALRGRIMLMKNPVLL